MNSVGELIVAIFLLFLGCLMGIAVCVDIVADEYSDQALIEKHTKEQLCIEGTVGTTKLRECYLFKKVE